MSSAILTAGQARINELRGLEQPLVIDKMIFAMIPGLDDTAAVDRSMTMPDAGQIVHTADIPQDYKGYVGNDQVVYSVILGTDVGDWSFNMIGLVEAGTGTLIAVSTLPETPKRATNLATNTTGNMITRNFVLSFQDAQNLTGITVSAETWQFDYLAELAPLVDHVDRTDNPHGVSANQVVNAGSAIHEDAQESLTDMTLNRLMRVGACGIGLSGENGFAVPKMAGGVDVSTDWNTITKGGWWNKVLGTGSVNKPAGGTGYWYCLALSNDVTGAVTQIAFPYGVSGNPGTIKYRTLHSGTWTDWIELFHTNNTGTAVSADVQESKVDTTEGRLLTVGAFGLGGGAQIISVGSLNDVRQTGFYYATSVADKPAGAGNGWLLHETIVTEGYCSQTYTEYASSRRWFRAQSAGAWSAWRELLHTENTGTAVAKDAQTSVLDTTAERLLMVGSFGLGNAGSAQAAVLDNTKTAGQYRYQSTDPDVPEAGAYGPFYVYVNSSTAITQVAFRNSSADMWIRYWNGSVWASWVKVYHTGNFATNKLLAENGFQELPGGLIMQWGVYTGTLASGGSITLTLPTTFPNAAFPATMSERGTDITGTSSSQLYTATTSTITLYNRTDAPRSGIGYHIFGY